MCMQRVSGTGCGRLLMSPETAQFPQPQCNFLDVILDYVPTAEIDASKYRTDLLLCIQMNELLCASGATWQSGRQLTLLRRMHCCRGCGNALATPRTSRTTKYASTPSIDESTGSTNRLDISNSQAALAEFPWQIVKHQQRSRSTQWSDNLSMLAPVLALVATTVPRLTSLTAEGSGHNLAVLQLFLASPGLTQLHLLSV